MRDHGPLRLPSGARSEHDVCSVVGCHLRHRDIVFPVCCCGMDQLTHADMWDIQSRDAIVEVIVSD